jgi:nitric oxide synthase-interacting protein
VVKACGHVVCKPCTQQFIQPIKRCAVCDKPSKDIIDLVNAEGTGFSSGGHVQVVKFDVAFQG